jgi:hypothetical protein
MAAVLHGTRGRSPAECARVLAATRVYLNESLLSLMKIYPLVIVLAIATVAPAPLLAQDARPRAQGAQVIPANKPDAIDSASAASLKHFDLEFPGGSPREFVAMISQQMGKPLNVVIPESNADVQIMPIKVSNVTVPELFRAIQSASAREIPIVTANQSGMGGGRSIQFKTASLSFRSNSEPVTDETIWAFQATGLPTEEYKAALQATEQPNLVCQYFQLAPHLEDHTIEDITTAIQTGWKMLRVDPVPQLSFHKETKLLIAVGAKDQIEMIPQVLGQLQADNTAGLEKIAKLQAELAEIEAKKEDGWTTKAQEKREQISQLAALIRAREAVRSGLRAAPHPGVPKAGN